MTDDINNISLKQGNNFIKYRNIIKNSGDNQKNIEGFTNKSNFPLIKTLKTINNVDKKVLEKKFNTKLDIYKKLNQQLSNLLKSSGNVTEAGNNIIMSNGNIQYVTEMGVAKNYLDPPLWDATRGQNGCPDGYNVIPQADIQTAVDNNVVYKEGTPMQSGQACGNAGKNVIVDQGEPVNMDTVKYQGCFKDSGAECSNETSPCAFDEQMMGIYTVKECAQAASDKGKTIFGIQADDRCWLGNDLTAAQQYGKM